VVIDPVLAVVLIAGVVAVASVAIAGLLQRPPLVPVEHPDPEVLCADGCGRMATHERVGGMTGPHADAELVCRRCARKLVGSQ
jgi:hypothetical protein